MSRWATASRSPSGRTGSSDHAGGPIVGICAATLWWTIVVLRDGRRCRSWRADVAQLVAHHLAKVRVAGSNPVIRSKVQWHQPQRWSGRVVRQRPAKPCTRVRFPSPPPVGTPGAISSAGERFPDTEEVTGSIPVSRTSVCAAKSPCRGRVEQARGRYVDDRGRGLEAPRLLGCLTSCAANATRLSGSTLTVRQQASPKQGRQPK